jgi:hypothetical protein
LTHLFQLIKMSKNQIPASQCLCLLKPK